MSTTYIKSVDMDALQKSLLCKCNKIHVMKSNRCKPINYVNKSHMVRVSEILQSLCKDEALCEIKLQTDDGKMVIGHKVVLASASSYFHAMFTTIDESNTNVFNIRYLDSTTLQLLVDYIYTGKIIVTEQNVKVLLPAADLLKLDYVKGVCVEFLQKLLDSTNCLGIRLFADLHNCTELLSSSEVFIKKHFLEVVKYEEFLSLSPEEVIKLISCNYLTVPFEEKVFECVMNWVKHALGCRYDSLPKLMEHIRLPLASYEYISKEVAEEPLLKNNPKCKQFVIEALDFHELKTKWLITIPQTIRSSPRLSGHKVVLLLCFSLTMKKYCTNWYDPTTNLLQTPLKMSKGYSLSAIALIKEHYVIALSDECGSRAVEMLDLSSTKPCWVSMDEMLVSREGLGVGVIDNCLYAVGGSDDTSILNSVEMFDVNIQEWRMVSSMSSMRSDMGIGVLNNLLYAVGGYDGSLALKSIECYDPSIDTWTLSSEMSIRRFGPGVGVLNDEMYAIGGHNGEKYQRSVEIYNKNSGVWTFIADMQLCRFNPGVFTLHGLLYVIGGSHEFTHLDSLEIYNPKSNTWSKATLSKGAGNIFDGIVIDKPPLFRTN